MFCLDWEQNKKKYQKKFFFLSGQALTPPQPPSLSGRATKKDLFLRLPLGSLIYHSHWRRVADPDVFRPFKIRKVRIVIMIRVFFNPNWVSTPGHESGTKIYKIFQYCTQTKVINKKVTNHVKLLNFFSLSKPQIFGEKVQFQQKNLNIWMYFSLNLISISDVYWKKYDFK